MSNTKALVIACAALAAGSAFAQYSGAALQRDIQSTDREKNVAAIYFISGVVDQTTMISNTLSFTSESYDKTLFFCIPETVKLIDIYAVVKARMEKPLIALSEPAVTHVTRAVRDFWPCKKP